MSRLAKLRNDGGFTAIEMVISILILGIIVGPILSAYILGVGTTAQANASSASSSDAQNVSDLFASDVASADKVSLATGCGSGTEVALFDLGAGADPRYVSYVANEDVAAETPATTPAYTLTRVTCTAANATNGSFVIANTMNVFPTLTCLPSACSTTASTPTTVSLKITEWGGRLSDPTFQFTVTGSRRRT